MLLLSRIRAQSHIRAGAIGRPLGSLLRKATGGQPPREQTMSVSEDAKTLTSNTRYLDADDELVAEVTSTEPLLSEGRTLPRPVVTLTLPTPGGHSLTYTAAGPEEKITRVDCWGDPLTGQDSFTLEGRGDEVGDVYRATYYPERQILTSSKHPGSLDRATHVPNLSLELYRPPR